MIIDRDIYSLLRRMDWLMFGAILCLAAFGISFIYSACYLSEEIPVRSLYKKQAIWALAGTHGQVLAGLMGGAGHHRSADDADHRAA